MENRRGFLKKVIGTITAGSVVVGDKAEAQVKQSPRWLIAYMQVNGFGHGADDLLFTLVGKNGQSIMRFTSGAVLSKTVKINGLKLVTEQSQSVFDSYVHKWRKIKRIKLNKKLFANYDGNVPVKYRFIDGALHVSAKKNETGTVQWI